MLPTGPWPGNSQPDDDPDPYNHRVTDLTGWHRPSSQPADQDTEDSDVVAAAEVAMHAASGVLRSPDTAGRAQPDDGRGRDIARRGDHTAHAAVPVLAAPPAPRDHSARRSGLPDLNTHRGAGDFGRAFGGADFDAGHSDGAPRSRTGGTIAGTGSGEVATPGNAGRYAGAGEFPTGLHTSADDAAAGRAFREAQRRDVSMFPFASAPLPDPRTFFPGSMPMLPQSIPPNFRATLTPDQLWYVHRQAMALGAPGQQGLPALVPAMHTYQGYGATHAPTGSPGNGYGPREGSGLEEYPQGHFHHHFHHHHHHPGQHTGQHPHPHPHPHPPPPPYQHPYRHVSSHLSHPPVRHQSGSLEAESRMLSDGSIDPGPGPPIQLGSQATGPEGANVFIFHLPATMSNTDLFGLFAPFGEIVSARIMIEPASGRSRGFGFVSYSDPRHAESAIAAMDGFQIQRKRLKVQLKRKSSDASPPSSLPQSPRTTVAREHAAPAGSPTSRFASSTSSSSLSAAAAAAAAGNHSQKPGAGADKASGQQPHRGTRRHHRAGRGKGKRRGAGGKQGRSDGGGSDGAGKGSRDGNGNGNGAKGAGAGKSGGRGAPRERS